MVLIFRWSCSRLTRARELVRTGLQNPFYRVCLNGMSGWEEWWCDRERHRAAIEGNRRRRRADDKTTNIGESEWQGAGKEENAGVKLGNRGPVVAIIMKAKTWEGQQPQQRP